MGFFDILKTVGKGTLAILESTADKASELKLRAKEIQQKEMVHKNENELKKYAIGSGARAYAARLELKERGLL